MLYFFIDESGDSGEIHHPGSSPDFAMAACVCDSEYVEHAKGIIRKLILRLRKAEIKFSKLSWKEVPIAKRSFDSLSINNYSVYASKTSKYYSKNLIEDVFSELIQKINVNRNEKVKVFVDGSENAYFRKLYEPIIRKKFPGAVLRFANSMKTPMVQVADFYAGYRRSEGR